METSRQNNLVINILRLTEENDSVRLAKYAIKKKSLRWGKNHIKKFPELKDTNF